MLKPEKRSVRCHIAYGTQGTIWDLQEIKTRLKVFVFLKDKDGLEGFLLLNCLLQF